MPNLDNFMKYERDRGEPASEGKQIYPEHKRGKIEELPDQVRVLA